MRKKPSGRAWLRYMSLSMMLLGGIGTALPGFALTDSSIKEIKISVKVEKKSLKEILELFQTKSGLVFVYSERLVSPYTNLSLNAGNESLAKVLARILKNTNLDYQEQNGKIVLVERSSKTPPPATHHRFPW